MKQVVILLATLALGACGFQPMYGSHSGAQNISAAQGLDDVEVEIIPDAGGVVLRNHLIDRFYQNGYPPAPRYSLSVTPIQETVIYFDITVESETTSRQLTLATTMTLTDRQSGAALLTRALSSYASYNVIGSQFTTRVSEADAREAAITDLARQIETQLALYFNR